MHPIQVVSTTHGQPLSEGDNGSDKGDKGEVVDVVDIGNKMMIHITVINLLCFTGPFNNPNICDKG